MDFIDLAPGLILLPIDGSIWTQGIDFKNDGSTRKFYHVRKPDEIGPLVTANADRRRPFYQSEEGIEMFDATANDLTHEVTAYTAPLGSRDTKVLFLEYWDENENTAHKEKHIPSSSTPADILHEMKIFFLENQEQLTPQTMIKLLEIERKFYRR